MTAVTSGTSRRPVWANLGVLTLCAATMAGFLSPTAAAAGDGLSAQPSAQRVALGAPGPIDGAGQAGRSAPLPTGSVMVDTVVSNTDTTLAATDTYPDGEPSIAVDPANPQHIIITAFSSCWKKFCDSHNNAVLWTSTNAGAKWTKSFSVIPPPNRDVGSGCPCDQSPDYGRGSRLYSTFLAVPSGAPVQVYTGSSKTPAASWTWQTTAGTANPTNAGGTNGDQPWLLVNRDPAIASQDNVYVAYDDFAVNPTGEHVAASPGPLGATFPVDRSVGTGPGCCVNPGLRLAADPQSGAVYALWEQATFNGGGSPKVKVQYMLNRSTDGGHTWSLNGSATGIQIASKPSDQVYDAYTFATYKFGTVNALLGGIDHATVDPATGDVYYVFGQRDPVTKNNRLSMVRLHKNSTGGLVAGPPTFLTGQVQAALPSVAVAKSGEVGVLYDTFDGRDHNGFPVFSSHLARSKDKGLTFSDLKLLTFSSPMMDNGNSRQRILGDYQQLKTVGMTFYATFAANGAAFGRSFGDMDPIFASVPADPIVSSAVPNSVARGATKTVTVNGTGFLPGAVLAFSGTGITVGTPTITSTTITASVTVASTAPPGPRTVSVSNSQGGQGTCACFSVT